MAWLLRTLTGWGVCWRETALVFVCCFFVRKCSFWCSPTNANGNSLTSLNDYLARNKIVRVSVSARISKRNLRTFVIRIIGKENKCRIKNKTPQARSRCNFQETKFQNHTKIKSWWAVWSSYTSLSPQSMRSWTLVHKLVSKVRFLIWQLTQRVTSHRSDFQIVTSGTSQSRAFSPLCDEFW